MPFPYVFPFYFETDPLVYGITVTVRIAFADDMFDTTPTWSDVSAQVLEVHTKRGRKHQLARMEAGTCTFILDNASGDFYADNGGGAYAGNIKTMKRVNIRAQYGAAPVVDVFNGYVESWTPGWLGKSGKGPIVTVVCSDALKVFARALLNNAGEVLELTGVRVGNVADEVLWPAGWRDIDTGKETLAATGAQANVNALDHYHKLQESELALIYIAPDNDLQFEDRSHRTKAPHDSAELVFGGAGEASGQDRYEDVTFQLDESLLFNDIRMTRTGGSEQTYTAAASQTAYGIRSLARSGLLNSSDIACSVLAEFVGQRFSTPVTRVKTITIRPGKNPGSLWYKLLNYDISTRVNVVLAQASIDKDYFIEGVSHDWISKNRDFTTKWELSDANQDYPALAARDQNISPDAAGDEQNINNFTEATAWESVVDGGTATYAENNDNFTTFDRDLYNLETPGYPAGTINSITVTGHFMADSDPKTIQGRVKLCIKSGATVDEGPEETAAVGSYSVFTNVWADNPDTLVAWTWADLAALQAGPSIKRATPFGGSVNWTRCKYIVVTVNYTPTWA